MAGTLQMIMGLGKINIPETQVQTQLTKWANKMVTPLVPVSLTPKPLTPGDIAKKVVACEDNAISEKAQCDDGQRGNKTHTENGHSGKIFDLNGLDEKYLTSILLNTPKRKLWKNSDHAMVKA